jgi:Fic family protein
MKSNFIKKFLFLRKLITIISTKEALMTYIHELPNWPNLYWDEKQLMTPLVEVRHQQGLLLGRMNELGFETRNESSLEALTAEIIKSSKIEGEILNADEVRSSLAQRLGIDIGGLTPTNRHVESILEMMLDATQHYQTPLSKDRLFAWHNALFPTGRSILRSISVGTWRPETAGSMQVVSGPMGRERIHFETPTANRLDDEMTIFLDWFNHAKNIDPILKAGAAHFWFVTIHPFEDGKGSH